MIRLTVPAALPSISTSRGWTTTASATAGFVTAMRVTSNSIESTVDRPAVRRTRSKPLASVAWAAGEAMAIGSAADNGGTRWGGTLWGGTLCAAIGDVMRQTTVAPNARRG